MSDESIDKAAEKYQRDQAEGERDDKVEERVTRGSAGKDETTRQQNVAERDPAEGPR